MTDADQQTIDVEMAVREADARIGPYVLTTPVVESVALTAKLGSPVALKCENLQHTGSFKARGALNMSLALTPDERERGIVTASTGNHGAAVAHAACIVGTPALVFVPEAANPSKIATIERLGAQIRVHGADPVDSEAAARRWSEEHGLTYISPYNDIKVIGGQGTLGLELLEQVERLAAVYVAVGGGGLASGVAGVIKALSPSTRVIGCSPSASAVMYHSLQAGQILDLPSEPTMSDGTAGGVEAGSITLGLLQQHLDDFVLVSEADIRAAFLDLIEIEHMLAEGSAAMAYAACRQHASQIDGATVVILCGGNVGVDRLRTILD